MNELLTAEKAEQIGSGIAKLVATQEFIIFFGETKMSERQLKTYLLAPHIYGASNRWQDIQYNGEPLFLSNFESNFEEVPPLG